MIPDLSKCAGVNTFRNESREASVYGVQESVSASTVLQYQKDFFRSLKICTIPYCLYTPRILISGELPRCGETSSYIYCHIDGTGEWVQYSYRECTIGEGEISNPMQWTHSWKSQTKEFCSNFIESIHNLQIFYYLIWQMISLHENDIIKKLIMQRLMLQYATIYLSPFVKTTQ